jgi:hypothetical protein
VEQRRWRWAKVIRLNFLMRLARSEDASANVEGARARGLREARVLTAAASCTQRRGIRKLRRKVEKVGALLELASCLARIIPCFRVEGMMQYGVCVRGCSESAWLPSLFTL